MKKGTIFKFPENTYELNDEIYQNKIKNSNINLGFTQKYIEKSELTIHLEDFLEFLLDKNIQIDLPSQVQVKYFDFDKYEEIPFTPRQKD